MDHKCILIFLCLFGISTCANQDIPINHRPIADRVMHHILQNQNFMHHLKYLEDFQFDFSGMSDQSLFQTLKPSCLLELMKISQGPDVGKYLDALGKPSAGLFDGNTAWIGNYEECMSIPDSHYCDMKNVALNLVNRVTLLSNYGVCAPKECDIFDVTNLLNSSVNYLEHQLNRSLNFIMIFPANQSISPTNPVQPVQTNSLCYSDETYSKFSNGAIAMIVISSIIFALCVIGTTLELILTLIQSMMMETMGYMDDLNSLPVDSTQKQTNLAFSPESYSNIFLRFFLCFSIIRNSKAIFNTDVPSSAILSINGIRTLSIWWVILGHLIIHLTSSDNPVIFLNDWLKRFSFQAIGNAPVSVDSFFVLSGLLVGYLSFKRFETHGKLPLLRYYLHRYIRLTPSYLYLIFFVTYLYPYFGSGPTWRGSPEAEHCSSYWWTNILYINNIYPDVGHECYVVSWYLANDMQFYIISPLIMWVMYRFKKTGVFLVLGVFIFEVLLANGLLIHLKKASPIFLDLSNIQAVLAYQIDIYFKPWTRIGPYILGIVLGYIMFYKKTYQGKYPKLFYAFGWFVAFGLGFAVVYGPYSATKHSWSEAENIIYGMSFRLVWAVALCWVIYACHNGHGSIINDFLGWKVFIPLSRLTYGVYLIHYYLLDFIFDSMKTTFHTSEVNVAFLFIPIMVTSYFMSYIVAVCIEYPVFNLEKLFLKF
ncbi:nose resistant to fluoxetine protein 6-like [Clytia hemisphaerica]|uniref:Nose resistant-to-fluoxetine protein N-terminal domain-containing protein n=1 Tax=Clytia hemisphaerica TaxID=252671 RepID=A0A7M5WUX6_9CNID